VPMAADTGPIGGDLSHEFIILAETGESQVWCHQDLLDWDLTKVDVNLDNVEETQALVDRITAPYAATDEQHDEDRFQAEVPKEAQRTARGIEVGHIFFFADKYSKYFDAKLATKDGGQAVVQSGSYGVGVSRLAGGIIEASHDESGIVWPEAVAPFRVALINLRQGDEACDGVCEDLYAKCQSAGIEVIYDDRDDRAGVKFADMELIGIPWQIVIGPRGVKAGIVEMKNRKTGEKEELSAEAALSKLAG